MNPSVEQQLMDRVHEALNTDRPDEVPIVERATLDALEGGDTFARMLVWVVDDEPHDIAPPAQPITRGYLRIAVEMRAAGAEGQPIDQAIDPMYVWAVSRLVGNTLGGLANQVTRGRSQNTYAKADFPYVMRITEFLIDYATPAADVTVGWGARS